MSIFFPITPTLQHQKAMQTQQKFLTQSQLKQLSEISQINRQTMPKRILELWHTACRFASWLLIDPTQPLIHEKRDRHGRLYWKVYDPRTGHSIICDSEQEVCVWIEEHWFGDRR
jgi:hypothetical protein